MSLTAKVTTHIDRITEDGVLHVKTVTRVMDGDKQIGSDAIHRKTLQPGADLTGEPENVVALATACWAKVPTEVIAEYEVKRLDSVAEAQREHQRKEAAIAEKEREEAAKAEAARAQAEAEAAEKAELAALRAEKQAAMAVEAEVAAKG